MFSHTGFLKCIKTEQVVFLRLDKLIFALMNSAFRLPQNVGPAGRLVTTNQACFHNICWLASSVARRDHPSLMPRGSTFPNLQQQHLNRKLDQTN